MKKKIKFKNILLLGLMFSFVLLALLLIFKPVKAMIPPPASRIWLFLMGPAGPGPGPAGNQKAVTVKVEWKEKGLLENVTIKTFLNN